MNKVTFLLQDLPLEYRQLGNWPKVDEGGLPAKIRAGYLRNKASIEAFMAGESVRLLCKKLDLRPVVFYRNLKRCLTDHPDG